MGFWFLKPLKHLNNQRTAVSSITQHRSQQYMHHTRSNIFTRKPSVVCGVHAPTKAAARVTIKRQKKKKRKSTLKAGRRRRGAPGAEVAGTDFPSCSSYLALGSSASLHHIFTPKHISVNTCKWRFGSY